MNIDNIRIIIESNLWKKMIRHKGYRGYKIVDTISKKQRISGQFFCLLVFFEKTNEKLLKGYLKEGKIIGSNGEGLDNPEIHKFYGTMQMVRFS